MADIGEPVLLDNNFHCFKVNLSTVLHTCHCHVLFGSGQMYSVHSVHVYISASIALAEAMIIGSIFKQMSVVIIDQ